MADEEGNIYDSSGNIFLDLGFPPEEAANLLLRSSLAVEIERYITARGLRQREAADIFGVTQPEISYLVSGKIERFSIDKLVNMLARIGKNVKVKIVDVAEAA